MEEYYPLLAATPLFADIPPQGLARLLGCFAPAVRRYEKGGILFMGTFHPAALLRSPQNKPAAFADFTALRDNIETVCKHTYHKD